MAKRILTALWRVAVLALILGAAFSINANAQTGRGYVVLWTQVCVKPHPPGMLVSACNPWEAEDTFATLAECELEAGYARILFKCDDPAYVLAKCLPAGGREMLGEQRQQQEAQERQREEERRRVEADRERRRQDDVREHQQQNDRTSRPGA